MAGMAPPRGAWVFHLSGGRLCLDFANTVSWRRGEQRSEETRLNSSHLTQSRMPSSA